MSDYYDAFEDAWGTGMEDELDTSSQINTIKPQRVGFVGTQYNELPLTDNWYTMVSVTEMAQFWKCDLPEAQEKLNELAIEHHIKLEQEKAA